jgi:hypothetical protein
MVVFTVATREDANRVDGQSIRAVVERTILALSSLAVHSLPKARELLYRLRLLLRRQAGMEFRRLGEHLRSETRLQRLMPLHELKQLALIQLIASDLKQDLVEDGLVFRSHLCLSREKLVFDGLQLGFLFVTEVQLFRDFTGDPLCSISRTSVAMARRDGQRSGDEHGHGERPDQYSRVHDCSFHRRHARALGSVDLT